MFVKLDSEYSNYSSVALFRNPENFLSNSGPSVLIGKNIKNFGSFFDRNINRNGVKDMFVNLDSHKKFQIW